MKLVKNYQKIKLKKIKQKLFKLKVLSIRKSDNTNICH